MEELYRKVYIQGNKDFPKESGMYECLFNDHTLGRATFDITDQNASTGYIWWTNHVIWYLQPLPQPREVTDEDIESHFRTEHYDNKNGHHYRINKDRIFGAKWCREQMKLTKQ